MLIPEIFERCTKITMSKRQDYTSNPMLDNHENFRRSAEIAGWFQDKDDRSYVVLIGTKLARLASLLIVGKKPNNETIDDTFLDLINYCALWYERRSERDKLNNQGAVNYVYPPVTSKITSIQETDVFTGALDPEKAKVLKTSPLVEAINLTNKLSVSDMRHLASHLNRYANDKECERAQRP